MIEMMKVADNDFKRLLIHRLSKLNDLKENNKKVPKQRILARR